MAKIQQPPKGPVFPWGGPKSVRERLVDPSQLERSKKKGRKGDPKNPALPSAELLDSIGPAHTADELRLPLPPHPRGHDADLASFSERGALVSATERGGEAATADLERVLANVSGTPERMERLRTLLAREQEMLQVVRIVQQDVEDIQRRIREEQKESGY